MIPIPNKNNPIPNWNEAIEMLVTAINAEEAITAIVPTINDIATIIAQTTPEGEAVTWTSDDTSIATVSAGVITAKAAGNATITATITVDGDDYTDTCAVTVTAGA